VDDQACVMNPSSDVEKEDRFCPSEDAVIPIGLRWLSEGNKSQAAKLKWSDEVVAALARLDWPEVLTDDRAALEDFHFTDTARQALFASPTAKQLDECALAATDEGELDAQLEFATSGALD